MELSWLTVIIVVNLACTGWLVTERFRAEWRLNAHKEKIQTDALVLQAFIRTQHQQNTLMSEAMERAGLCKTIRIMGTTMIQDPDMPKEVSDLLSSFGDEQLKNGGLDVASLQQRVKNSGLNMTVEEIPLSSQSGEKEE